MAMGNFAELVVQQSGQLVERLTSPASKPVKNVVMGPIGVHAVWSPRQGRHVGFAEGITFLQVRAVATLATDFEYELAYTGPQHISSLRQKQNMLNRRRLSIALIAVAAAGCEPTTMVQPEHQTSGLAVSRDVVGGQASISVSDVEELYAAVNDPTKAGFAISLAPGTYTLSAKTAGGASRPNGGRIELQSDMSLTGVSNDREAVVIDMSLLPLASLNIALGRTAGIRIGRGNNSIQWMTIVGNPNSAAGIETDLADGNPTQIVVAHVVAHESIRGVDVRNTGAAMSGRLIVARLEDNEFFRGAEGIRVLNSGGTIGGQIDVTMSGNQSHDNANGCIVEHNRASSGSIQIRSSGDQFTHNGLGCLIGGGLVAAPGSANSNVTVFEAHGDTFADNTLTQFVNGGAIDFGGVLVLGAETPGVANSASHNSVQVSLWGTKVSGNQHIDFEAYGARSVANPVGISGIDNHATIELHGVSKQIDVVVTNSLPTDPSGTNSVTVVR